MAKASSLAITLAQQTLLAQELAKPDYGWITTRFVCPSVSSVFNPHEGTQFQPSTPPQIQAFRSILIQASSALPCSVAGTMPLPSC